MTQSRPDNRPMERRPWCGNASPQPPVSRNSPTILRDGDLILIRFHGTDRPTLLFHGPRMEACPPSLESHDPVLLVLSAVMASQRPVSRMLNRPHDS